MFKKLRANNMTKSLFIVLGGTSFAQGLNIILSPVITRVFTPEEYGIFTAYSAIVGLLSLGAFKYELAIPIEKAEKKAINILALSFIILTAYVVAVVLSIILFKEQFLSIFGSEILNNYSFLIPFGIYFGGLYTILTRWAYRNRDYKTVSKTKVNQSLFSNLTKVISGVMNFGSIGLIVGHIIGMSSGIRVLLKPIFKRGKTFFKMINRKDIFWSLKRYKDFPIYNMPSSFLLSLGGNLPIMFYSSFFGSIVTGYYGLAYTIVKFPINLIGNEVADVFFSESANIGKDNPIKLNRLFNGLIKKLILIGLIPLSALLLFGPELFSLVFGAEWSTAGEYASIISLMTYFMLIATTSGKVFIVFEKQNIRLLLDIIRIILVLLMFGVSYLFKLDIYKTIALYSIVMSFSYILIFVEAKRILKNAIKDKKLIN